jgi:ribosome maturation protein SDO1
MVEQNQEHSKLNLGEGNTIARITKAGKHFEIIVDMKDALAVRKKESNFLNVEGDTVFTNVKKGDRASKDDLEVVFGTSDITEIAKTIVSQGEVLISQEVRSEEQEKKFKQIINFFVTNAIDAQSGNPYTESRIRNALEEIHINIKNTPVDQQIQEILPKLSAIIPIKLDTKKVKITIPAIQTGKAYGVIAQYKKEESWKDNGDLEVIVEVPSGIIMDFFEKLNNITHGSAVTEEIKE